MSSQVVVLVGTTKGAFFFFSDEQRRDWRVTGPHMGGWEIYSLLGDPHGARIFAGTSSFVYGPTIRVSEDMGANWEQVANGPNYSAESGFKFKRIWQLAPGHPSEPDTLYAGVEEAGLFVSRDHGQTWQEVDSLTSHPTRPYWWPGGGGMCLHTILIDPNNAQRMWVAASAIGLFRSDDGGATWNTKTNGLPAVPTDEGHPDVSRCVHKVVLDPRDSNTMYMQFHGGVFKSTDAGDNWTAIENGLPGNFGFPMVITAAGDVFIVPLEADTHRYTRDGKLVVYRSRDGGASWAPSGTGLPDDHEFVGVLRDAMATDPFDPAGIYFGTTMGTLFYSADAGDTWQKLPGTYPRITYVKTWVR